MTNLVRRVLLPAALLLAATATPGAPAHAALAAHAICAFGVDADSSSAVRAVEAFRAALARGDSAAALAMLSPDVLVLESGDVERYADYRSHHLSEDIAYARANPGTHTLVNAQVDGNAAWVASTSITRGQFNGRAVNSAGAELVVLTRVRADAPWMIRAIHWSSHRRPS